MLSSMSGLLGGLIGGAQKQMSPKMDSSQMPYRSHMIVQEGDGAYDTAAEVLALVPAAGVEAMIWLKTIPAQQQIRFGYGSPAYPQNQGYMYFFLLDATTGFSTGTLRIRQANARRTKIFTVAEFDDTRLHAATVTSAATARPVSKDDMIALPEKVEFPKVGEDSRLELWYSTISVPAANDVAEFSIPVTVYQ